MSDAQPQRRTDPLADLSALWRKAQPPDVRQFLDQLGPLNPDQLLAVLRTDQQRRWHHDKPILAETYLAWRPELTVDPEHALELVYNEFLIREQKGEAPTLDEYLGRFPQLTERFRQQIELHQALAGAGEDPGADASVPFSFPSFLSTTKAPDAAPEAVRPQGPVVPGYEI